MEQITHTRVFNSPIQKEIHRWGAIFHPRPSRVNILISLLALRAKAMTMPKTCMNNLRELYIMHLRKPQASQVISNLTNC